MKLASFLGSLLLLYSLFTFSPLQAQSNCYTVNTFTQNSKPVTWEGEGTGYGSVTLCAQAGDSARVEVISGTGGVYDSYNNSLPADASLVYVFPYTGEYHVNFSYDFGLGFPQITGYQRNEVCVSDNECWYEEEPIKEIGPQSGVVDIRITYLGQTQISPAATLPSLNPTPVLLPATATPFVPAATLTLQYALHTAQTFTGSNADWQALYPTGFVHTFTRDVPMVLVPVGCFMMGDNTQGDERPEHEQCFDQPFWIDQTEVTVASFVPNGGQKAKGNTYKGFNRPIETITWFEARDFCALRGARLPTESEWEYAARGAENLTFPWGNDWNAANAVSNRSKAQGTADVGSIPDGRSWVGALDMSGNVWEWVSSLYLPYNSQKSRESASSREPRVLRGGSWVDHGQGSYTTSNRFNTSGNGSASWIGFRCVRSA